MKIGGLDIGTTGCKLTVFTEDGSFLNRAYRAYDTDSKEENTIDASCILSAVYQVMEETAAKHPDLSSLGVTSFGESFVAADAYGRPLHEAMLYTDPRGEKECGELTNRMGGTKAVSEITGLFPHHMYSLPKMMWLFRNRPEIEEKTRHLFLMEDFIVFHLTGVAQIDHSLATRTMAFDLHTLNWNDALLEKSGIDQTLLSRPVPSGTVAGTLTASAAERTGFSTALKIISVSHDQVACTAGSGVFNADTASEGAGTVECLNVIYDQLPDLTEMARRRFAVVPYILPGKYISYAFSYTGGALIQWCVETMAKHMFRECAMEGSDYHDVLEEGMEKGPTGILVLPHFAGAATPYMDTGSMGAILGLRLHHGIKEIYQACMEGIGYELYLNLRLMRQTGARFSMIHSTGGGSRSARWMQMKADLLNLPVRQMEIFDAGTVGCVMLTGTATGVYKSLEEAADILISPGKIFSPRSDMHQKYQKVYHRYQKVYHAVRPLFDGGAA